MKGRNARYIEHRGANAVPDRDREILLEGEDAVYQEIMGTVSVSPDEDSEPTEICRQEFEADCFRNASEFVRLLVAGIVKDYYLGSAANLALIEIALYDHNLLLKRNKHTALVKTLVAWGTIDPVSEEDIAKIANGMAYKMRALPSVGYREWKGDGYVNDRKTCSDIGKELGATIPYSREKDV